MKFKNTLKIFIMLLVSICLFSCEPNNNKTDHKPVILGASDQTIDKGTKFVPLAGITATDKEDGDLTDSIKVETNVNYNVVGTYTVTYTVYDSAGNKDSVTITVKVVENDKDAPIISGVANKEIIVGEEFDPKANVTAIDVIDGDLTSSLQVTGEVDVWTVGKYEINYSVKDAAGNEATAKRIITVSLGYFEFKENVLNDVKFEEGAFVTKVSSGEIDKSLESFCLAKVSFKATVNVDSTLTISFGDTTRTVNLTKDVSEYTVYARFTDALTDETFKIETTETISDVSLQFGFAKDTVKPVITVPEDLDITLPGNVSDESILTPFITKKLEATDNIDGIITSKLVVDFSTIDLGNYTGTTELEVSVTDTAGNKEAVMIPVTFTKVYDTKLIENPQFDSDDISQFTLNGGADAVLYVKNGELVTHTVKATNPGWDSASSPALRTSTDVLKAGYWYMLKFDAYADKARQMTVRIGLETDESHSWIENFEGANNFSTPLTTEKQTYYVIFYVHADKSVTGNNSIKLELKVGTYTWGSEEQMNPVHFDNMQFYLLSNDNTAPVITPIEGKPTTFGKGSTLPSFTSYVEAYDLEDGGILTLTDANVDLSQVDVNKVGTYPVVITVRDSGGKEVSHTITIKIIEEADVTAPVVTITPESAEIKQNEYTSLEEFVTITIVDDIDGDISFKNGKVTGEYDLTKIGVYKLTYTVSDSSGNVATKEFVLTVTDGEAPVINVADKIDYCIGDEFDITSLITITDNVDGKITLDKVKIDGTYDLTKVGSYNIEISVSDVAGNKASKKVTLQVFKSMGDTVTIEDFESYSSSDDLNVEDGNLYRRWLPWEADAQTLNDLVLVTYNGTNAALFRYNSGGESIFVRKVNEQLPSKYLYLRFMLDTTAEKIRVWFYTESGKHSTEQYLVSQIKYDENGYYYIPIADADVKNGEITAVGISMNYQSVGSETIIDEIGFSTTAPTTVKDDFIDKGEEKTIYDFIANEVEIDSGSKDMATVTYENNTATIAISSVGDWDSAAKMKISLSELEYGKSYTLKITVKADQERYLKFNLGQGLWDDPWMEKFTTDNNVITITNEYKSYKINFTYDVQNKEEGPKLEFCFGKIGHTGDVAGNNIYISEFVIIEYNADEDLPDGAKKIEITSNNKDGYADYLFSDDHLTVTLQTIYTKDNKWGRFDFAKVDQKYVKVVATFEGTEGLNLLVKLDTTSPDNNIYDKVSGNKQYKEFGKDKLVVEWDLTKLGIDSTLLEKLVFYAYDSATENVLTEASFKLVSLVFYPAEESEEPVQPTDNNIKITGSNVGSQIYSFSSDLKVVTISSVPAEMSQWARWDFSALSSDVKSVTLTIKTTEGYAIAAKLDGDGNPYDKYEGNKQYKATVEGNLVFTWNLDTLNISPEKIIKLVFWVYDKDQSVTTASFEFVSLTFE